MYILIQLMNDLITAGNFNNVCFGPREPNTHATESSETQRLMSRTNEVL